MKRLHHTLQLLIVAALLIVVNLFGSAFFARFDLTREGRYSLSDLAKETARSLDYPMVVTVYLEGAFPPNIREFQEAVRTTLAEMRQYASGNLEYEFTDPSKNPELLALFKERRFEPVPVQVRVSSTETRQQVMWPLALVRYREREVYVDLLKGASVFTREGANVDFIKAEADLEYKLVSAMRNLLKERSGVVAYLQGHGELSPEETPDLLSEIQTHYTAFTFDMARQPGMAISPSIDVLLILQPERPFSERDKYEIDQYLMRGGSILWSLSQQQVDFTLAGYQKQSALTQLRELNLDDLFFRYGFKINYDLVQDAECETSELVVEGSSGASMVTVPWPFFPLVLSFPEHPVTRNVDAVLLRYAGSIDTFAQPGVRKSVFLKTSPRSRTVQGSQFIDIDTYVQSPPPAALFNKPGVVAGVLMEGIFGSLFAGREAPVDSAAPAPPTAAFGPRNNPAAPGAMAVIADGEFARGKLFQRERAARMPYDNKTLLINAIDYLAGDEALTQIRSREVVARRISREKAAASALPLKILNLGLPVALLAAFGLLRSWLRRRRNQQLAAGSRTEGPHAA